MSIDPEYLKLFTKFHHDRMTSFHSDKEYRCKGCDSERYFIIEDNALIYSCSLDGEGNCVGYDNTTNQLIYGAEIDCMGNCCDGTTGVECAIEDDNGICVELSIDEVLRMDDFQIHNIYPNTFNPTTSIEYILH